MSVGDCLLSDIRVAAFWYYKAQPQPITARICCERSTVLGLRHIFLFA